MPFTNKNDHLIGRKPIPFPAGGELLAVRFELAVVAGDLALNSIGAIGKLPAGCVPVDAYLDHSDLDTGAAAMVAQVGIWDGAGANLSVLAADGGAHWGVGQAVNTAAYQRITPNGNAIPSVLPSQADRLVGIKITTAPTAAAAGTLGLTLLYRAP